MPDSSPHFTLEFDLHHLHRYSFAGGNSATTAYSSYSDIPDTSDCRPPTATEITAEVLQFPVVQVATVPLRTPVVLIVRPAAVVGTILHDVVPKHPPFCVNVKVKLCVDPEGRFGGIVGATGVTTQDAGMTAN